MVGIFFTDGTGRGVSKIHGQYIAELAAGRALLA
jgi:hypothetical protein